MDKVFGSLCILRVLDIGIVDGESKLLFLERFDTVMLKDLPVIDAQLAHCRQCYQIHVTSNAKLVRLKPLR